MFFYRSMKWPSLPAFNFFHSSNGTQSGSESSPAEPRRWALPVITLPSIQTVQSYLPSLNGHFNSKPTNNSNINNEHFQICLNLVHHIIDICASSILWLFSPVFQLPLDVLAIQGALKLWMHGLAIFMATIYGMHLVFWLAHQYIFQLTSLYGILQTLVLIVSLRAEQEDEKGKDESTTNEESEEEPEEDFENQEDRWAGGSEDEDSSQAEWENEGAEEEVWTD